MSRAPRRGLPDTAADALLRVAARRWPAELSDDMAREWAAEVHALRHDTTLGAATRATRQLRFAVSLAVSRPATGAGTRAVASVAGPVWRLAGGALLLLLVPYLGGLVVQLAVLATTPLRRLFSGYGPPLRWDLPFQVYPRVGVLGWLGVLLVLPLAVLAGRQLAAARPFGTAPTVALLTVGVLGGWFLHEGQMPGLAMEQVLVAGLCAAGWLVALLALLPYARRTARTRPLLTTVIAMGGALLTAALAATLATALLLPDARPDAIAGPRLVLWYPILMGDESTATFLTWNSDLVFDRLPDLLPGILLATTAFAVPFLARGAREPLPVADPALPSWSGRRSVPGVPRAAGPALILLGTAVWVTTLGVATPLLRDQVITDDWTSGQAWRLPWAADLRFAGLLVVGVGLLLALVRSGRRAAPALPATVALFAANVALDHPRLPGVVAGVAATLTLMAVVAVTWRAARAEADATAGRDRRLLAGATVVAAYCAPALLSSDNGSALTRMPPVAAATLVVGTVLTAGALASAAVAGALTVRATTLRKGPAVILLCLFGAAPIGLELVLTGPWSRLAGLPLVIAALAVAHGRRARRPAGSVAWWAALVALSVVAAYPALLASVLLPQSLSGWVRLSFDSDVVPLLPGAVLVGALLAWVAGRFASRRPADAAPVSPAGTTGRGRWRPYPSGPSAAVRSSPSSSTASG